MRKTTVVSINVNFGPTNSFTVFPYIPSRIRPTAKSTEPKSMESQKINLHAFYSDILTSGTGHDVNNAKERRNAGELAPINFCF